MNPELKAKVREVCEDELGTELGLRVAVAVETSWELIGLPRFRPPTRDDFHAAANMVAGMIEAVRGTADAAKARARITS